tara:strand:+ start:247 stop:453 length:207 start_codon:yes stop_codon:yes gene_type:complete
MSESPEPSSEITLGEVASQITQVLEMNDLLHSELGEIKSLLKNLVELSLALKKTELPELPDDNDTMYG